VSGAFADAIALSNVEVGAVFPEIFQAEQQSIFKAERWLVATSLTDAFLSPPEDGKHLRKDRWLDTGETTELGGWQIFYLLIF